MTLAFAVALALAQSASGAPSARPLPGHRPCPFPAAAERNLVGGPVSFLAQVGPDWAVLTVEIVAVPAPGLGFEETVRACVLRWRFEPAPPGASGPRPYAGRIRYEMSAAEEKALRDLLERAAAACNSGDARAFEDLEHRPSEMPELRSSRGPLLADELAAAGAAPGCRLELDADLAMVRFLRQDVAQLRQGFRCVTAAAPTAAGEPARTLELMVARGARGWRAARVSEEQKVWLTAPRVGSVIAGTKASGAVAERTEAFRVET